MKYIDSPLLQVAGIKIAIIDLTKLTLKKYLFMSSHLNLLGKCPILCPTAGVDAFVPAGEGVVT